MKSNLGIVFIGCGDSDADSAGNGDSHADGIDHDEHDADGSDANSDMDLMKEELAKLSPEDAASAEKQHVCPVADEMLGTMGAPIKVDVQGRDVWICCETCRDELLANPDEYLAKLADD